MRSVLVTGGTGFLGHHLVAALQARGNRVRVLTRRPPGGVAEAVELVPGDVRDPRAVEAAMRGVDVVVHLVSNFRHAGSDAVARAINVEGTDNVVAACRRAGVARLVHCSTVGVHGDVAEIPAHEGSPFNPGDEYQRTKLVAEQRVLSACRDGGLPAVVVRPMSMYGPGDRRMLKLFRMVRRGWFLRIGSGRVLFHPAYVGDVVEAFLLALDHPNAVGQAFIVGSEGFLPLDRLVASIAEELGVRCRELPLPLAPMLALARACEALCPALGVEPPLHRRRLSFYRNNRAFSLAKARDVLGFRPKVGLREGLRRTVRWYREHGWL